MVEMTMIGSLEWSGDIIPPPRQARFLKVGSGSGVAEAVAIDWWVAVLGRWNLRLEGAAVARASLSTPGHLVAVR